MEGLWQGITGAGSTGLDFQLGNFRVLSAAARTAATTLLDSYDSPREFMADWKWMRLLIPLQVRLFMEQILWDRAGQWRQLVTGFRPVSESGPRRP